MGYNKVEMMIARYRALTPYIKIIIYIHDIILVEMMIARYRALTPTPKGAPQPFKKRVEMMIARYRALTPHDQGSWRTAVTAMLR